MYEEVALHDMQLCITCAPPGTHIGSLASTWDTYVDAGRAYEGHISVGSDPLMGPREEEAAETDHRGYIILLSRLFQPIVLDGHRRPVTGICFGSRDELVMLCTGAQDYIILWSVEAAKIASEAGQID